jgi:hypothetical protein
LPIEMQRATYGASAQHERPQRTQIYQRESVGMSGGHRERTGTGLEGLLPFLRASSPLPCVCWKRLLGIAPVF